MHCPFFLMHYTVQIALIFGFLSRPVSCLCPAKCKCDDASLSADCTDAALDVLPITLNPSLARLLLPGNHIRSIQQTLSFYGGLELLDLRANHLTVLGQANLAQLRGLQKLLLASNRIHKLEPGAFAGLEKLNELSLSGNLLSELPEAVFRPLHALRRLDLSRNHISHLHAHWSAGLDQLRKLDLNRNRISSLTQLAHSWSAMPLLEELILAHNPLHSLSEHVFTGLSHLRILNLRDCALQHIHIHAFKPLFMKLTQLWIDENPLSSLKALHDLTELTILSATSVQLHELSDTELRPLRKLNFLRLGDEPLLEKIHEKSFEHNSALESLELEQCPRLTKLSPMVFANLTRLKELRLRQNSLQSLSSTIRTYLRELRSLWLAGNPLHCDCETLWLASAPLQEQTFEQISQLPNRAKDRTQYLHSVEEESIQKEEQINDSPKNIHESNHRNENKAVEEDEWINHISSMSLPPVKAKTRSPIMLETSKPSKHANLIDSTNPVIFLDTNRARLNSQAPLSVKTICTSPTALHGLAVRSLNARVISCASTQSNPTKSDRKIALKNETNFLHYFPNSSLLLVVLSIASLLIVFMFRARRSICARRCGWSCSHFSSKSSLDEHRMRIPPRRNNTNSRLSGNSMKPLCSIPTNKCLFDAPSFDSTHARYSKLRLLPHTTENSYGSCVEVHASPENHEYEQIRYFDTYMRTPNQAASRLYENPLAPYHSSTNTSTLRRHHLPPMNAYPFAPGHLV